ncbi:peptide chain release factor N(5)-glutamine methyltransferase [Teichococcus vastitatis]|uniref:Release factor glutamine methyltransferase n=1 Tax=Teichococcus vastitatis TaxID=2307076 RepID=A0ABS9W2T1_9PROT|nr:peptide chain release factor N(5)-glutamine methyltransferase [Pseudoroseomonas vastitatis]MCI0753605.1 peptide chain release factor N(5)-glutamine methyltransferase [Pseudoroseomonas vastitatis]
MSDCSDPAGTVGAFLCRAGQHLRAAAIENPRLEARLMLGAAMGREPSSLLGATRAPVPPVAASRFASMLRRRQAREPLALILGRQGFWTLDLAVSPATLVPRADSEVVVEAALASNLPPSGAVLDLGTGTGCLLLAILSEWPGGFGIGVDLSPEAAALACSNARRNGLEKRCAFFAGHWADAIRSSFDLVLSNPPYIESAAIPSLMPEVRVHEPARALDGGPDGLDAYRLIVRALPRLLKAGGSAVLELGLGQAPAVTGLAEAAGLAVQGSHADLGGVSRALVMKKPFGGSASGR